MWYMTLGMTSMAKILVVHSQRSSCTNNAVARCSSSTTDMFELVAGDIPEMLTSRAEDHSRHFRRAFGVANREGRPPLQVRAQAEFSQVYFGPMHMLHALVTVSCLGGIARCDAPGRSETVRPRCVGGGIRPDRPGA